MNHNYIEITNIKCSCQDDIIKSIALIETSIAYILESESKKLDKIIKDSHNISDILKANESINKTIINVTKLEIILYHKLKLVKGHC